MAFPSLVTSGCVAGLLVEILEVADEVVVVVIAAVVRMVIVWVDVSVSGLWWSAAVDGMVTPSEKCSVTSSQPDVLKSMTSLLVTVILSVESSVASELLVMKELSIMCVGPSVSMRSGQTVAVAGWSSY